MFPPLAAILLCYPQQADLEPSIPPAASTPSVNGVNDCDVCCSIGVGGAGVPDLERMMERDALDAVRALEGGMDGAGSGMSNVAGISTGGVGATGEGTTELLFDRGLVSDKVRDNSGASNLGTVGDGTSNIADDLASFGVTGAVGAREDGAPKGVDEAVVRSLPLPFFFVGFSSTTGGTSTGGSGCGSGSGAGGGAGE